MHQADQALSRSLLIQGRVLHACLMREVITRFGRHNLGVLWLVGGAHALHAGCCDTLVRGAPAITAPTFRSSRLRSPGYSRCSVGATRRALHRWRSTAKPVAAVSPQRAGDRRLLLTRCLLELGGATGFFIVLTAGLRGPRMDGAAERSLKAVLGWAFAGLVRALPRPFYGRGNRLLEFVEKLWHPVAYLLFPLSGAAFMVEWLPESGAEIVLCCRWCTASKWCATASSATWCARTTASATCAGLRGE